MRPVPLVLDDYVTPDLPQQLYVPLLRARLRRSTEGARRVVSVIEDGRISLDLGTHETVLDGHWLDLTPIEFALPAALARHPGQVLSADQLLHMVVHRRDYAPEASFGKSLLWGIGLWLYAYHLFIVSARAFVRTLRGRNGWAKTRRNAEPVATGPVALEG
ncbi:hypothetical protein ACIBI8_30735 [Streptomyces sp. NPDC050529]|uniref:hypothetical protein n=1 Tax=Streptomyces sp. NPDC050529 TaxID=3365624 RepID=UPI0037A7C653